AMDYDPPLIQKALAQLLEIPVLQTSHHITPTHGPTFLALDLICQSGLQPSQLYLVAANSGVSFSNSAWSGALSYGFLPLEHLYRPESAAYRQALKADRERTAHGNTEQRISLIPSRQRDQLLFGTLLTDYQTRLFPQFSERLQGILPEMVPNRPFSQWSAMAAAKIQNRIFCDRKILIFDINRVAARYLVDILTNQPEHPCAVLLSNAKKSQEIFSVFADPPMFLGSYRGKKSAKVDPLFWRGRGLEGLKTGYRELSRQDLIQQLEDGRLCPGIFLLFFILRFLNGIRCLGSFSQVRYLEQFRLLWEKAGTGWNLDLEPDFHDSLTTGRLYQNDHPVWPLDLALNQQHISVESFSEVEMGHFWSPIVKQLTGKAP
ncbi:MAG: hypothetical protein HQ517_13745, partial [SAR324 cluster bacterium]|nr:hypothetical protein [SAR324 cluster bacterium]